MEPIDYQGALIRRWWWILILGVIGALIGLLIPVNHAKSGSGPTWKTTAFVGAVPSGAGAGELTSGINVNQIIFYAHKSDVAVAAAKAAGVSGAASKLQSKIEVTGPAKKSGVAGEVKIQTIGKSAKESAAFTNAFVAQLGDYIDGLFQSHQHAQLQEVQQRVSDLQSRIAALDGGKGAGGLTGQLNQALAQEQLLTTSKVDSGYQVLQPAMASSADKMGGSFQSLTSNRGARAALGFLLGALIALVIILVLEAFDKSLRTVARAESAFDFPVIAEIPGSAEGHAFDASPTSLSHEAEAFRILCASVLLADIVVETSTGASKSKRKITAVPTSQSGGASEGDSGAEGGQAELAASAMDLLNQSRPNANKTRQVVLVVSAATEPARPMVVANLAATFAESGQSVLVSSTQDLRVSSDLDSEREDSGVISASDLEAHLVASRFENVSSLPLDDFVENRVQLITRAPLIFEAARELADVVIIEAPSLLAFLDAEAVAPCADIVLVVGDASATSLDQAKRAGELLRRIGAPVIGVVLTSVKLRGRDVRRASAHDTRIESNTFLERRAVPVSARDLTPNVGAPE
jgi:Mrp family chromosome partitioning ATPase